MCVILEFMFINEIFEEEIVYEDYVGLDIDVCIFRKNGYIGDID